MSKRLAAIIATLLVVGFIPAMHAEAASAPQCGTDPTTPHLVHGTIDFHADLACPGLAGLKLDGPATIKLNGHTFSSNGATGAAVDDTGGFRLKLLGPGTISHWDWAVESTGRTQVQKLTFDTLSPPLGAIVITANKAKVDRNTFKNIAGTADYLVTITGDKAKVRSNNMTDFGNNVVTADISVIGNKALVSGNQLDALAPGAEAIFVEGSRAKIVKNKIFGTGGNGIHVDGSRIQIKKNLVTFNMINGVFIEMHSTKVVVTRNTITDNQSYGVETASATNPGKVKHNTFANNTLGKCDFMPCS